MLIKPIDVLSEALPPLVVALLPPPALAKSPSRPDLPHELMPEMIEMVIRL